MASILAEDGTVHGIFCDPMRTTYNILGFYGIPGRGFRRIPLVGNAYPTWLRSVFPLLFLLGMVGIFGGVQGCASLAQPNWRHPGTAQSQQLRAHQFDPYPEDDLGPSVEGSRPSEFQNPPSDLQRARPHELRRRWFPGQTEIP